MNPSLIRAKQIIEARMAGPATAVGTEYSIALEHLGPDIVARDKDVRRVTYPEHGYLSPMAATEAFADILQRGLATLASNLNVKVAKAGKYSPLLASPRLFKEAWRARQMVDELSIPYWFYVEYAVLRWYELGNRRMPRPAQLTSPDIAMHVMQCWADPEFRYHYPLLVGWDVRFEASNYVGDEVQQRVLALIDQHIADARVLGYDEESALAPYVGSAISRDEAVRRYGENLVHLAMELQQATDAEFAVVVKELGEDSAS